MILSERGRVTSLSYQIKHRAPTWISDVVASLVESSWVELQTDDGEDDDREEEEEGDVDQRTDGFSYRGHDNLETWTEWGLSW